MRFSGLFSFGAALCCVADSCLIKRRRHLSAYLSVCLSVVWLAVCLFVCRGVSAVLGSHKRKYRLFSLSVSGGGLREHFSGLEEKYFSRRTRAPKTSRWSENPALIISPHYSVCCLPRSRLPRHTEFPPARTRCVEVCLLN